MLVARTVDARNTPTPFDRPVSRWWDWSAVDFTTLVAAIPATVGGFTDITIGRVDSNDAEGCLWDKGYLYIGTFEAWLLRSAIVLANGELDTEPSFGFNPSEPTWKKAGWDAIMSATYAVDSIDRGLGVTPLGHLRRFGRDVIDAMLMCPIGEMDSQPTEWGVASIIVNPAVERLRVAERRRVEDDQIMRDLGREETE